MEFSNLPTSLGRLAGLLKSEVDSGQKLNPKRVKEIVLQADVQEEDLAHYADFDHPIEDCYGRKMVLDYGAFEIMVMSWNPRDYSSIHNHGYTQWGVVQVFGNVHHFIYQDKEGVLDFAKKEILVKGSVVKVNNNLIHQMGNPSSEPYYTLHVYGSNERTENVTADAKNYDLEFDRISHTTGGAFLNLPAEEIYDFQEGPTPSSEVFHHYAYLLLDYYDRQEASEEIDALRSRLLGKLAEMKTMNLV